CDGVDQDCDGIDDNSAIDALPWYSDLDLDGFGDPATLVTACSAPSGTIDDGTDCDDTDAGINPAAAEICDPADTDEDCDGDTDDADSNLTGAPTWYVDADQDGFGDVNDPG